MSASKRRGTAAETKVVAWLREHGWPHAERRALAGALDRGDVAGMPGVVVECKDEARPDLAGWVDEALAEARNDGADVAVVVRRRRGRPDVGSWFAVTDVETFARLLRQAGYGTPLDDEDAA